MKLIVYTALFASEGIPLSDVGEFFPFIHDRKDVEYIAFTNRKDLKSEFWDVKYIDIEEQYSPRMKSRMVKWDPLKYLPKHDYSLWLDSQCYFTVEPKQLVNKILENNKYHTAIHHHGDLNSVYLEGLVSSYVYQTDLPKIINKQLEDYFEMGHPFECDHFETGILVRRNCNESELLNSLVRNHLKKYSIRDQICTPYCVRNRRLNGDKGIKTIKESFVAHNHKNKIPKSNYFFTIPKPTKKLKENLEDRENLVI